MSISVEQAEEHKHEIAVLCCRTEEGTIIGPDNLEDPMIIPELADTGLVEIPDNPLKIGQVIGAKLTKTVDSLTPLTTDILENLQELEGVNEEEESIDEPAEVETKGAAREDSTIRAKGPIKIVIEEGKGIDIELII